MSWHDLRSHPHELVHLDRVIRHVCLAAIPVVAVSAYLLRSKPLRTVPPQGDDPSRPRPPGVSFAPLPESASSGEMGRGFEPPPGERDEPPRLAVDLPLVENPRRLAALERRLRRGGRQRKRPSRGSCGGTEVRLITVSEDPAWSIASVAESPGAPGISRRVGDGVGRWTVAAIEWDRVWLEAGGRRCEVPLHDDPAMAPSGDAGAAPSAGRGLDFEEEADVFPMERDAGEAASPAWEVPVVIATAIRRISKNEYAIARSAVGPIFERGSRLLEGLSFEPATRDDAEGLELSGVKEDSFLYRLGIEDGDVVLELNGEGCGSIESAADVLRRARDDDRLVARVDRRGEVFDLDVRVR